MKSDIEIARSIELTKIKQIPTKPEFLLNTLVIMADI